MDNKLIGGQITRYRKERNLTQEELGKAVGVSTQAVSRWENGGAPDVTLLPAIADKLGVTIDALFGREGGERVDVRDVVARWARGVPKEQRLDQFCRLIWSLLIRGGLTEVELPNIEYPERVPLRRHLISEYHHVPRFSGGQAGAGGSPLGPGQTDRTEGRKLPLRRKRQRPVRRRAAARLHRPVPDAGDPCFIVG